MALELKIKRGLKANLPALAEAELAFVKDEKSVYIGLGYSEGNIKIGSDKVTYLDKVTSDVQDQLNARLPYEQLAANTNVSTYSSVGIWNATADVAKTCTGLPTGCSTLGFTMIVLNKSYSTGDRRKIFIDKSEGRTFTTGDGATWFQLPRWKYKHDYDASGNLRGDMGYVIATDGYGRLKWAEIAEYQLNTLKGIKTASGSTIQAQLDGKASKSHGHSAADITSGTLPIARGGTGATTAADVVSGLGIVATIAELNHMDGVTSNVQTQLNSKAAANAVETLKMLPRNGMGAYMDFVIPLCELTNTNTSAPFYVVGEVFLKRTNTTVDVLPKRIRVWCGKNYNQTRPSYYIQCDGSATAGRPLARTFMYNGIKYFGIYVKQPGANFDQCSFVGRASDMDIIQVIPIYNNNTKTVMNEEIYNSLTYEGETEHSALFYQTPYVSLDGGANTHPVYHAGNKPTLSELGAAPAAMADKSVSGKSYKLEVDGGKLYLVEV